MSGEFTQVSYEESDHYLNPDYISYGILGWVESKKLTTRVIRHYYHLTTSCSWNSWKQETDHHVFNLFWAQLDDLPLIVPPQDDWLKGTSVFFLS